MSFKRKWLRDSFKKKFHVKHNIASHVKYHAIHRTKHKADD